MRSCRRRDESEGEPSPGPSSWVTEECSIFKRQNPPGPSMLGATFPLPMFAMVANATSSVESPGGVSTVRAVKSSIAALGQGAGDDGSWDTEGSKDLWICPKNCPKPLSQKYLFTTAPEKGACHKRTCQQLCQQGVVPYDDVSNQKGMSSMFESRLL